MRGLRGVASAVTRRKAARRAVRQAGRRGLAQLAAAGAGGQALAAAVIIDGARAASMAAAADPFSDENITKLWELAKLAYEPDASPHAVMELLDTRAIINTEDNVLAFRGTATKTDALKDVCYTLTPCRDYPALFGDAATGRVHQGFALAAESVFEELVAKLDRTFAARSSQRRRRRGRDVDSVEMSRGAYDVDIQWKQVAHHRYKTRAPDGPFVGRRFSRALRRGLDEKRRRRARVHLRRAARRRPGGMLPSRCMFFVRGVQGACSRTFRRNFGDNSRSQVGDAVFAALVKQKGPPVLRFELRSDPVPRSLGDGGLGGLVAPNHSSSSGAGGLGSLLALDHVLAPRGYVSDESRRGRGRDADSALGPAAAATVRGDELRRRRGRDAENPWRRVAAATRRVRGDDSRRRRGSLDAGARPQVRDFAHVGTRVELEPWDATWRHAVDAVRRVSQSAAADGAGVVVSADAACPRAAAVPPSRPAAAPAAGAAAPALGFWGTLTAAASQISTTASHVVAKSREIHGCGEYDVQLRRWLRERRQGADRADEAA